MIDYRFAKAGAMWHNVFHLNIAHFVYEGDALNSKSNLWVYKEEDIDMHMENVWELPKKQSIVIRDLEDWTVFDNMSDPWATSAQEQDRQVGEVFVRLLGSEYL